MSNGTWRGTLLFTGTLATLVAAAGARFASADTGVTSAAAQAGTSTAVQAGTSTGTQAGTAAGGTSAATGTATVKTGSSVQTPYGPVQVAVTFTGGKITAVQALKTPGGRGYSVQVNAYAAPILAQEAVAANSANIQSVSGATYTSEAYKQSLQSAIDQKG
jgi:uncharacterized protein with FMN-binding domain